MNSTKSSSGKPFYINTANWLGEVLSKCGVKGPSLSSESLLQKAMSQTGLDDFGDKSFTVPLSHLLEDLETNADLSPIGRQIAYFNLVDHLSVRLQLADYRARNAAVANQKITSPLFIMGLPRTGTSILFELIAQDPAFRSPSSWEVAKPLPPPKRSSYSTDPRIRRVGLQLALSEKLSPGFRAIHAIGASLPQECVYMFASQFLSEQYGYMYNLPNYRHWALTADMTKSYEWHHNFLQHLQVDYSQDRWLLKTPSHIAYLHHLFAQYPDALVVWTHRNPIDAVSSFSSLLNTLRRGFSDNVNPALIGEYEIAHSAKLLKQGIAQRGELNQERFIDVSFSDICSDPIQVIRNLYERLEFDFSPVVEYKMREYLRKRPRDLYGEHIYSPAEYGIDGSHGALFSDYQSAFGQYCV